MTHPPMRRAVAYARVSSKPQEASASRETQFDRIHGYAGRQNLTIIRPFQDVGTGLSTKERPKFIDMVDFACDPANQITDVIVDDLSRFTRSARDYYPYMDRLEAAGITLHSALEGAKFGADSEFTWGMICLNNERNSRLTSIKTKTNQRAAVERGQCITGKPPYGYKWKDVVKDGRPLNQLVRNPAEWPHLLEIINMALKGYSPLDIAKDLNRRGIPGPTGQPWGDEAVRYILQNEHNLGKTFRGKNPKSKLPGRQEPMEISYGHNTHEAALSEEDYKNIKKMIKARTRTSGPTRCHSSPNFMSGKVKCGPCRMAGHDSTMIVTRKTKGAPITLRCSRKKNQGKEVCPTMGIPLDELLRLIMERLLNHILTEQTLRQLIDDVAQESRAYLTEGQQRKTGFSTRLSDVEKRIRNLSGVLQAQGNRALQLPTLIDDLAELEKEKKTLQENIQEINDSTEEARLFINDPERIVAAAIDLRTYTDPHDEKAAQALVSLFISSIYVYKENTQQDHLELTYTLPIQSERTGEESQYSETVVFKQAGDDHQDDISCLLAGRMGVRP